MQTTDTALWLASRWSIVNTTNRPQTRLYGMGTMCVHVWVWTALTWACQPQVESTRGLPVAQPSLLLSPANTHMQSKHTSMNIHTYACSEVETHLAIVFSCYICHVVSTGLVLDHGGPCCHTCTAHYGLCSRLQWFNWAPTVDQLTLDMEAVHTMKRNS